MADSTTCFSFPSVVGKDVNAYFDGGDITSDSGFLLLSMADAHIGLISAMAGAIRDTRQQSKIAHNLQTLLKERVFAITSGYEDANDLDSLRLDPALKTVCGRAPQTGEHLAGQSTVSRLENSVTKKDLVRMAMAIAQCVVGQLPSSTRRVVLDLDEMEDPCHGQQEFEFFNAHYDSHCYLPLLLFVTDETGRQRLMAVVLRPGKSGCNGVRGLVKRAVHLLRARFPEVEIELRADAGYGNDKVLRLCDGLKIDYTLGLPGNSRLHDLSIPIQMDACIKYSQLKFMSGRHVYQEFGQITYKADSWDKVRTVIVKSEVLPSPTQRLSARTGSEINDAKLNSRFVVTNRDCSDPQSVYAHYCQRGDRENRIKEFNLDMSGGRTSCHRFLANQCRVSFHAAACILMSVLQEAAKATIWAKAQMGTLRLRLLKVGARIKESVRRIWIHMSSSYPNQRDWQMVYQALTS